MKENIIQAIVAKMQRNLDCRQMVQLKAVLASELHNVEIIEKKECAKQQAQENEHLLNSFISAKKMIKHWHTIVTLLNDCYLHFPWLFVI